MLPLAVTITTGTTRVGAPRRRRQTSKPSIPGMTTSSSTRLGTTSSTRSSASAPEAAVTTAIALGREDGLQEPDVGRRVVDDEDDRARGHAGRKLATRAGKLATSIGLVR